MTRPKIVDTFPFHDELDLLECRLTELYDTVDHFVLVEAEVTHQDRPKPWHYLENAERFAPFADKIVSVQATGLPGVDEFPDPWAREHAQRDHIVTGIAQLDLADDDIILQSDVDEIPRPLYVRNVRPKGLEVFGQRGYFWAVDWLYPQIWQGTVAGTVRSIQGLGDRPFVRMRNARTTAPMRPHMRDAGWHLSWLGGPERVTKKVGSFCHPEVEAQISGAIANDNFYYREGFHVDGERMAPVDVDETWPKWIVEGNAPASWYRPRAAVAA